MGSKWFSKLGITLAGIAMAVGVGVSVKNVNYYKAFAADDTFTPDALSIDKTAYTVTTVTGSGSSNPVATASTKIRIYPKNLVTITAASGYKLNGVSISATVNANSKNKFPTTWSITDGNSELDGDDIDAVGVINPSVTGVSKSTLVFSCSGSAGNIDITSMTVNYSSSGPVTLAAPTGISYDSSTQKVSWTAVSHATGYYYSTDGGEHYSNKITDTYFSVSGLDNGSYSVKVKAAGDGGTNYNDSAAASFSLTKVSTPTYTSVVLSQGALTGNIKGQAYVVCSAQVNGENDPSQTVTWYITSSNTYGTTTSIDNLASINSDGKITFQDNGTVYVWGLAADGTTHNETGLSVVASGLTTAPGTENNPYTAAQAKAAIDSGTGVNNVYTHGIVSQIVAAYNANYGNISYNISDDGLTTSVQIEAYRGKSYNGNKFSSANDIKVGDEVVVYGNLVKYGNTYEVNEGNRLVSLNRPVKTLTASESSLNIGSTDNVAHTITVTIDSDATDQKINIAHQSGTENLFTKSASQVTATSGTATFTVTGTGATSGTETLRISSNSVPSKYADLILTAFDSSKVYWDVTFDSDGGSISPEAIIVEDGTTFIFPSPGTKEHYSFDGWSSDAEHFFDSGDTSPAIEEDTDYYAFWTEDEKHSAYYFAGSNGDGAYEHANNYGNTYTLLPFSELTGVTADSGYKFQDYTVGGVHKNPGDVIDLNDDLEITVNFQIGTTYNFVTNFATYASSWEGYDERVLDEDNLNSSYEATVTLPLAAKQANKITTMPVLADETSGDVACIYFELTEDGYLIDNVSVEFAQWDSKIATMKLFKGSSVEGDPLDTAVIGTSNQLDGYHINGKEFVVSCDDGGETRVQVGIKSITITVKKTWSKLLLDTFTCSGVTQENPNGAITAENPAAVWSNINAAFSQLSDEEKAALKTLDADIGGTIDEQALARYDLVIRKYGTNTEHGGFSDFIGRFSVGGANYVARGSYGLTNELSSNSTISVIIIALSMSALLIIGGYFFIRRRKER